MVFFWLDWDLMRVGRYYKKVKYGLWVWLLSCVVEGFFCIVLVFLLFYFLGYFIKCCSRDRKKFVDILLFLFLLVFGFLVCVLERGFGFYYNVKE